MVKGKLVLSALLIFMTVAVTTAHADSELSSKNAHVMILQQDSNTDAPILQQVSDEDGPTLWDEFRKGQIELSELTAHQIQLIKDYFNTDEFFMEISGYTRTELKKFKTIATYNIE